MVSKMSFFRRHIFYRIIFIMSVVGGSVVPSYGRVYIDIDSPSIRKFPIAVADFTNFASTPDKEGLGASLADQLGDALQLTGFFNIISKSAFLEDPNQSGITSNTIRFSDWITIGAESLIKGGFQLSGQTLMAEFRLFDVVQGKLLVGKRYTGMRSDMKVMILNFAGEVMLQLTGEKGVFDTKVAFIGKRGNNSEIYTVNFDGSNMAQLTHIKSLTLLPRWSPSGREMVFTSYRDGNPDLYLLDLHKQLLKKISSFNGLNLGSSWSPDGKNILVTLSKDGNQQIYIMNRQDGKIRRLTHDYSINVSPVWSPDGGKIAFVSDRSGSPQIFVMNADGGNQKRLTFEGRYNTSPSWSSKGKRIAFEGRAGGEFQIFTIGEDGENLIQLTSYGRNESPSWSPDGRYIAFTSRVSGRARLHVMNANGSNLRVLHEGMQEYLNAAWSPRVDLY